MSSLLGVNTMPSSAVYFDGRDRVAHAVISEAMRIHLFRLDRRDNLGVTFMDQQSSSLFPMAALRLRGYPARLEPNLWRFPESFPLRGQRVQK